MKIQSVSSIQNKIFNNRVSKPVEKAVIKNITTLGLGAATISGMYIVHKSDNYKRLKNLKLNDETINKILNVKNQDGEKVFNNDSIKSLSDLAKNDDKTMFHNIMNNLDSIKLFQTSKMKDGNIKYQITALSSDEQFKATYIPSDNIYKSERIKGLEKTTVFRFHLNNSVHEEIKQYMDKKLIVNDTVIYDKKNNIISRKSNINNDYKETIFNKNGEIINTLEVQTRNRRTNAINKDYKNKTKIISNGELDYKQSSSSTKMFFNSFTGKKEFIKMEMSDILGVYNTYITDEKGNIRTESFAKKNPDGSINVEKHFESLDGTKTDYEYFSSKDENNVKMHYQIKSSDGKVLMTTDRSFNRINSNLAYSSVNGHRYKIQKNNDIISVTDYSNNKTTNIKLEDLYLFNGQVHQGKLFDKLSGDMLLDMYKRGYKYFPEPFIENFCMDPREKIIHVSDNVFCFAHEQGHTKDTHIDKNMKEFNDIANNPQFRKIYEEERFNFIQNMSKIERDYIEYFVGKNSDEKSKTAGAVETVAEINALLSTGVSGYDKTLQTRVNYLQKYFPKTVAAAARFLMPNSNIFVQS